MKAMKAAQQCWKRFRWPLILLVAYLICEQLYVSLAVDDGVFFPVMAGQGLAAVVFGILVVGLRLLVYGLVPGVFAYKLVMALGEKIQNK